jgi:regulator of nucleoside diphosphate kinase
MKTLQNRMVIAHEDYEILNNYLKPVMPFDRRNATLLFKEIKDAVILKRAELPQDVVRLNSKVVIKEVSKEKIIELILVVPEKANIQENKVSVFAPIGIALIGFKRGEKVNCNAPSGNKSFIIMDVCNKDMQQVT